MVAAGGEADQGPKMMERGRNDPAQLNVQAAWGGEGALTEKGYEGGRKLEDTLLLPTPMQLCAILHSASVQLAR